MLPSPPGGVGGVDRHHPQSLVGAHLGQPIPEPPGRDARDHAAEAPAALAVSEGLAALSSCVGEVQVLDGDHLAAVRLGEGDELADSGPQPPISGGRGYAVEEERDGDWLADRVAGVVEYRAGEVAGVEVDRDPRTAGEFGQGRDPPAGMGPGGV